MRFTVMTGVRFSAVVVAACCAGMAGACVDSLGPTGQIDVRGLVTPELAATLDANGAFQYPPPNPDTQYSIISTSMAGAFASSWLEHSVGAIDILESAVDPDLSFEDLTVLSDAGFFATSPFADVPSWVPMPSRRIVGPWYLFPVMVGHRPVGTVSVSAWATDYGLDTDGTIIFPRWGGNAFRATAVTESTGQFTVPFTPERAAALAANRTGALVAVLPRLISAVPPRDPATDFKWEIGLDREVEWQYDAAPGSVTSRTVYVGLEPTRVPGATRDEAVTAFYQPGIAPDSMTITVSIRDSTSLELIDTLTLGVPIRPNVPAAFVVVHR